MGHGGAAPEGRADVLADLDARGLIHDSTDRAALEAALAEGPMALYYGCDPSADSLHVGNLIGLCTLRRFQASGHRAIALAGGATGMVGDPGGRSEERNLLDAETLAANVAAIKDQISRVLGDGGDWSLVDNMSWTGEIRLVEFLRDVGKHVTVNQMVARESVKARMASEQGISYTEFSYMLLQANDYLWLHDHEGCRLQIGGSDQWGNILSGVDLIRRARGATAHALCWPLLTAPDGSKIGKTTGARVWLDPERTSPYAFYQHFIQVEDADVRRQLAWFTNLALEEIDQLVAEHQADAGRRLAQRRLAGEVTALVHGQEAATAAEEASAVLFGGDVRQAGAAALELVAREVVTAPKPPDGTDLVTALVATGLAASNSEARRSLDQGAVAVNGERVGADRVLGAGDLLHDRWVVLRKGKKAYGILDAQVDTLKSPG